MNENVLAKLKVLAESAKYDVSCSSSGTVRRNQSGTLGNTVGGWGICHSFAEDGRCISLLKIMLTNYCIYDCAYCINRRSNDIYYMCGHMGRCEVNTLLADVDVYVSLHRSEGFGLVMAESMYVGTPVIATDWSGNTEFMNSDTACMVGYDMIELDKDYEPFKKGNVWADAHVDEAADYMRRLYEDKDFYERIAGNGQKYAREHLAYKRSADIVSERLRKIHGKS